MQSTTETSTPDKVAAFQARLSAMAEHQKRACILMAARGLINEVEDENQPSPPWQTRLSQKLSQFIPHPVRERVDKSDSAAEPVTEEASGPVIDVAYRVLDEKGEGTWVQ